MLWLSSYSQEPAEEIVIDDKYREDQFYLGVSFNIINNRTDGFTQSGFSGGLSGGFIRDFPLNKRRNIAIGIGLGAAANTYNQNLFIGKDENQKTIFRFLDNNEVDYDTNRFNTYLIEAPIEFRWRTSTPTVFQFWRIYGGIRLGYIYYFKSSFSQPGNEIQQTKLDELNRFRYGVSLSVGRGNFNLNAYYSLNSFFDGTTVEGQDINLRTLKIGLMFYIL